MTVQIVRGTLEARILELLVSWYPMTEAELSDELGVRERTMHRTLLGLQARGLVLLEPLPDKVFVRLLRTDLEFLGRAKKGRGKAPPTAARVPNDPAIR